MRNATCARTETSKLPTKVALLYGSLFYDITEVIVKYRMAEMKRATTMNNRKYEQGSTYFVLRTGNWSRFLKKGTISRAY
jgi:hypothetical protein